MEQTKNVDMHAQLSDGSQVTDFPCDCCSLLASRCDKCLWAQNGFQWPDWHFALCVAAPDSDSEMMQDLRRTVQFSKCFHWNRTKGNVCFVLPNLVRTQTKQQTWFKSSLTLNLMTETCSQNYKPSFKPYSTRSPVYGDEVKTTI